MVGRTSPDCERLYDHDSPMLMGQAASTASCFVVFHSKRRFALTTTCFLEERQRMSKQLWRQFSSDNRKTDL
jgi:hypothetical protein